MNQTEQSNEIQSPAQRAEIVAALACLACVIYLLSFGEPVAEWLQTWWAALLVYTFLPIALTFTILYGSCLHREMRKATRALYLFSMSLLFFAGVCLSLLIIVFVVCATLPLSRFHY